MNAAFYYLSISIFDLNYQKVIFSIDSITHIKYYGWFSTFARTLKQVRKHKTGSIFKDDKLVS